MKNLTLTLLLLAIFTSSYAGEVPQFIENGFSRYKSDGASKALEVWTEGSSLKGVFRKEFSTFEMMYGKMDSYEMLGSFDLTKRLKRYYFVVYQEKGPIFIRFDLYKKGDNWIVYLLNYNINPDEILPLGMTTKEGF